MERTNKLIKNTIIIGALFLLTGKITSELLHYFEYAKHIENDTPVSVLHTRTGGEAYILKPEKAK